MDSVRACLLYSYPRSSALLKSLSRSHVKMTGVTTNTCRSELTIPPSTGAANGFMNSAPVRMDHMSGRSPATTVATVITFGRKRSSAPSN
jgi:hypothetical protein